MSKSSKLLLSTAAAALAVGFAAAPASACPMYKKEHTADIPKYTAELKKDTATDNMSVAPTEQAEVTTEAQGVPTSGTLEPKAEDKAE